MIRRVHFTMSVREGSYKKKNFWIIKTGVISKETFFAIHIFFYKHAVYKHVRLKLAKKLSTLLSTPQAEILGKKIFLLVSSTFAFQVWHFYKYFSNLLKNWYKFIINDHDIDAILFVHINIITY